MAKSRFNHKYHNVTVPIVRAGGSGKTESSSTGAQASSSQSSSSSQGGGRYFKGSVVSSGGGAGAASPPPSWNNPRPDSSYIFEQDQSGGFFAWIFAMFNYWWMTGLADQIGSQLASHFSHTAWSWLAAHETLLGMGFTAIGVVGAYAAEQTIGSSLSLSSSAHRAILCATGLSVSTGSLLRSMFFAVSALITFFLVSLGTKLAPVLPGLQEKGLTTFKDRPAHLILPLLLLPQLIDIR